MKRGTVTALLPMKGHSERVPGKNIRPFNGRPLFHATLCALLGAELVDAVVINTDSEEIARLLPRSCGKPVIVHQRPEPLRGDLVSMNAIIAHDLSLLGEGHYLQTHSTNPLVTSAMYDSGIARYFEALAEGRDSLFSVTPIQARLFDAQGRPLNHDPAVLLRTQDLPVIYEENSCMYVFSRASFQTLQARIGERPVLFPLAKERAVDIDVEADFLLAEALEKTLGTGGG